MKHRELMKEIEQEIEMMHGYELSIVQKATIASVLARYDFKPNTPPPPTSAQLAYAAAFHHSKPVIAGGKNE